MNKLIIAFLFITHSLFTKSQDIKIIILDSLSNKPVSYASVCFMDKKSGTYANENGIFFTHKINQTIQISHIGYYSQIIKLPVKDNTVKLQPQTYFLNEITVRPGKKKIDEIGYYKFKSYFNINGFSGDELAVYFANSFNSEKTINQIIIGVNTDRRIKDALGVNFVSVFRVNFYSTKENSTEPDSMILKKDMLFTSEILEHKTKIDISEYHLKFPVNGIFVSIEWVGIESENTKELITDSKERMEPFVSTTFEKTNTVVYERNKFSDNKWKLVDKNHKYSIALKEDNFFTPKISLSLY